MSRDKLNQPDKISTNDVFIFWKTGFVGVALILSGIFFLLVNFAVLPVNSLIHNRVLSILFFIIGLLFAFFQGASARFFWLLIPAGCAFTIGVITAIVGIDNLLSLFAFSIFCLGLAITFSLVFFWRKKEWWALLPAGSLLGITAWISVAQVQIQLGYHPAVFIFFVGLSFLAIYFFSFQKKKMRFALLTGLILCVIAIFYYFIVVFNEIALLWPILLIALGIVFPLIVNLVEKRLRKRDAYLAEDKR